MTPQILLIILLLLHLLLTPIGMAYGLYWLRSFTDHFKLLETTLTYSFIFSAIYLAFFIRDYENPVLNDKLEDLEKKINSLQSLFSPSTKTGEKKK